MTYFTAVVLQNEDKSFSLNFPDVEGCVTTSDNMQRLIRNAVSVLASHFKDKMEIKPRSLAEISSDDLVKDQIGNGATLILVPLRTASKPTDDYL